MARTELQGGQIRDLSVGTADLANGAVTAAKLGVGAIIGTDIQPYAEALNGVKRITSKSATGSLATNECGLILASASTGQITLTLPAVAGAVGLTFVIQKTDTSANTVIVKGSGAELINDANTKTMNKRWDAISIESNGTTWVIKAFFYDKMANLFAAETTGVLTYLGSGQWSNRTILGTANQITVTSGDGVIANPSIAISANPIIPGSGGMVLPSGTTAQRGSSTEGNIRYNSTLATVESYVNGSWSPLLSSASLKTAAALQARKSTTTTPTNSFANIVWNAIDVATDTATIAQGPSNSDRIYVYAAGEYEITFMADFTESGANTTHTAKLNKNDTTDLSGGSRTANPNTKRGVLAVNTIVTLAANDYIVVKYSKSAAGGTSTMSANPTFTIKRLVSSAKGDKGDPGAMGGNSLAYLLPESFDNPTNSNWAVNSLAPTVADIANAAISVRAFDDTTEEGVGFRFTLPPSSTQISFDIKWRARTAPGSTVGAVLALYVRQFPNNAAAGSWSARQALTTLSVPSNANTQYTNFNVSYSTLGITAGNFCQFELVRYGASASDTLVGDLYVYQVGVSFT